VGRVMHPPAGWLLYQHSYPQCRVDKVKNLFLEQWLATIRRNGFSMVAQHRLSRQHKVAYA
jgi:hypothetical protein